MRYRHFSYRYGAFAGAAGGPQPLFHPWNERLPVTLARPKWRPPTDLYETAEALYVKVEAAGMTEEDFEVILYEDLLVIEGERRWRLPEPAARCHALEIPYGPLHLEVSLPGGLDRERVEARYDGGFLSVRLPKLGGTS